MRLVLLADLHLQPERNSVRSTKHVLRRVLEDPPAPDAVLIAGDFVMNSANVGLERMESQWALWTEVRREFGETPIYSCIGNQDCWGWNHKASQCTGEEPLYGKAAALAKIPLANRYYAVPLGGWRLIVLDSVRKGGKHGFVAELDAEQRAWLVATLESDRRTPTVVMTHVPLVPGPAEFKGAEVEGPTKSDDWILGGSIIHADGPSLVALFRQYPNVRLCLSGHTHIPQRIEFGGITFGVIPPLCGAWWRGPFQGFDPGYGLLELGPDGAFNLQSVATPQWGEPPTDSIPETAR